MNLKRVTDSKIAGQHSGGDEMNTIKNYSTLAFILGMTTLICSSHAQELSNQTQKVNESEPGWKAESGYIEFGSRVFINKPGTNNTDSSAKYNQYGKQTDSLFLKGFGYSAASKNGLYSFEFLGKDVGANSQALELDMTKTGEMYLSLGWNQQPNLRSNTATTIYNGIGTTSLTIPNSLVTSLNGFASQSMGTGLPNANVAQIKSLINSNSQKVTLGITRDNKDAEYRWTPSEKWDVRVNYSNEHRYGLKEEGVVFGRSATTSPVAAAPMRVDDTTQNAGMSIEYSDKTPWDKKWNFKARYNFSNYSDKFTEFTVENPFGGLGSPSTLSADSNCPKSVLKGGTSYGEGTCTGIAGLGTSPSNKSHQFLGEIGVDLPGFRNNRYMGTLQYSSMTQDQPFIPMTVNTAALGQTLTKYSSSSSTSVTNASSYPMPRNSLGGEIDTILWNNSISTQLNSDLKNKINYRFYTHDNNTQPLTLTKWLLNDFMDAAGVNASYAPHQALFQSYQKNSVSDALTYRLNEQHTVGIETKWENVRYSHYAANATDEYTQKIFWNAQPLNWIQIRSSDSFALRKYQTYDFTRFIGSLNYSDGTTSAALRDYFVSNRERNNANVYVDLETPIRGLTITPSFGLKTDNYPNAVPGGGQLGLRYDHNLSGGVEFGWAVNSDISTSLAYTQEWSKQRVLNSTTYVTNMGEVINTFIGTLNYQIIPEKLTAKIAATYAYSNDNWRIAGSAVNSSPSTYSYPSQDMHFARLDARVKYSLDSSYLKSINIKDAFLQLGYVLEFNHVRNWQNDAVQSYMYDSTVNTQNSRTMIFMSGTNNPNYHAQVLVSSLIFKW